MEQHRDMVYQGNLRRSLEVLNANFENQIHDLQKKFRFSNLEIFVNLFSDSWTSDLNSHRIVDIFRAGNKYV